MGAAFQLLNQFPYKGINPKAPVITGPLFASETFCSTYAYKIGRHDHGCITLNRIPIIPLESLAIWTPVKAHRTSRIHS